MSEVNEDKKNLSSGILNILLWILLLCLLCIPGYFFYQSFVSEGQIIHEDTQEEDSKESDTSVEEEMDIPDDLDTSSEDEAVFYEKFPVINTQQSYIAVPGRIDTESPPAIVVYNHGDLEELTDSISTDFMEKLREYALSFTSENFIFSASAIHDNANTDNNSVEDIHMLIEWVQENYTSSSDIYLIGFSRGGYTTTNYILEYPDNVKGVALLAPATYYTEWNQTKVDIIKDILIQIWHGTSDTNIAVIHSENFVNRLAQYDKDVILNKENGKAHYDVDDEYIDEIIDFFKSTAQ